MVVFVELYRKRLRDPFRRAVLAFNNTLHAIDMNYKNEVRCGCYSLVYSRFGKSFVLLAGALWRFLGCVSL